MIVSLLLMLAALPEAVVGGWDNRPTITVAEGYGSQLSPIKIFAEKCGFSRTWVWDDDTKEAQLWVLAAEADKARVACLRKWKAANSKAKVKWMLTD